MLIGCILPSCHNVIKWKILKEQIVLSGGKLEQVIGNKNLCSDYARVSAQRALQVLKSISVAASRSLPILVDLQGQLLSLLSVGLSISPAWRYLLFSGLEILLVEDTAYLYRSH